MDEAWLEGQCVWAFNSGVDLTEGLRAGLTDAGARVETSTPNLATQQEADTAIAELAPSGAPRLILISIVPTEAMQRGEVVGFTPEAWRTATCEGLRSMMYLLRALGPVVKGSGAAIVVAAPSLSLVGCPELVALSTLLEGQRGLLKSVARQWGGSNVTLNWAAIAPRALSPLFDDAPLASKPDTVSVAMGRPLEPKTEVAPILGFLASPAGRAITGATLTLDGGEWMVP